MKPRGCRSFRDDVDAAVAHRHRIAGEPHLGMPEMAASAHVELESVPRADDVERAGAIMDAEAAAVGIEPLLGALHQLALTDGTALVRAIVAPSIKRAVHAEDADLDVVVVDDDLAPAIRYLMLVRDKDFLHNSIVPDRPTPRQAPSEAPRRHLSNQALPDPSHIAVQPSPSL